MKLNWLAWILPIAFLAVAGLLIYTMLPSAPPPHPVQRLKDGAIKVGDPLSKLERVLGRAPSGVVPRPDGGMTLVYLRSTADGDFAQEDAYVDLDSSGIVRAIRFERNAAPQPSASEPLR